MLSPEKASESDSQQLNLDEPGFRYLHNEDEMAVNKLSEVSICRLSCTVCTPVHIEQMHVLNATYRPRH
jgi:hypothetical protein